MNIISSATDISTWISNTNPLSYQNCDDPEAVSAELTRLVLAADHPDYGTDWSAWLDENIEELAEFAMSEVEPD